LVGTVRALLKPYPERPPMAAAQKPYEPPSKGRYRRRRWWDRAGSPADDARQRGDSQSPPYRVVQGRRPPGRARSRRARPYLPPRRCCPRLACSA